jgi:DNA-binding IclR family transcriptional regulator
VCRLAFSLVLLAALIAVVIAELARSHDAKRRRREAGLAAEPARIFLGRADTAMAMADASRRLAAALGLPWAALRLDAAERNEPPRV